MVNLVYSIHTIIKQGRKKQQKIMEILNTLSPNKIEKIQRVGYYVDNFFRDNSLGGAVKFDICMFPFK